MQLVTAGFLQLLYAVRPSTSVDTKVDSFGRSVMNSMNAIGLVLVNGTKERAEWTSFQRLGNAVVDLIWVPIESASKVEKLKKTTWFSATTPWFLSSCCWSTGLRAKRLFRSR